MNWEIAVAIAEMYVAQVWGEGPDPFTHIEVRVDKCMGRIQAQLQPWRIKGCDEAQQRLWRPDDLLGLRFGALGVLHS